jgi:hypothetical protein
MTYIESLALGLAKWDYLSKSGEPGIINMPESEIKNDILRCINECSVCEYRFRVFGSCNCKDCFLDKVCGTTYQTWFNKIRFSQSDIKNIKRLARVIYNKIKTEHKRVTEVNRIITAAKTSKTEKLYF